MEQEPNLETLIFTRYLYPKIYVKHSLLLSILEHQYDESLFWAYELYYSGFQEELFHYIMNLYNQLFQEKNPKFIELINKSYEEWNKDQNKDSIIGTIVGTLSHMDYSIDLFMKEYFNINCKSTLKKAKKAITITCKPEYITKYYTLSPMEQTYKYLRSVGLYQIRTNIKHLFRGDYGSLKNEFYYDWLYYASGSPVWLERINEFKGTVNNETKKIEFLSEDWEELFYNIWGFEPDEQPQNIQDQIIGPDNIEQVCMKDFCEKYGSPIITKKITKSKKATKDNS